MKTYPANIHNLLLAPAPANKVEGGAPTTLTSNKGEQVSGKLFEDGDGEAANEVVSDAVKADTSANLDGQVSDDFADLKDIFGEKAKEEGEDKSGTRVVADKVTRKDGVEVVEEEVVPTKEELASQIKEANKKVKEASRAPVLTKADQEKAQSEATKKEQQLYAARDYKGLPDEDVAVLKKLPNAIYNHVAPLVRERSALRAEAARLTEENKKWTANPNRTPDQWYQNPNAYTLTPEFNKIATTNARAMQEAAHWEQQLIAIEGGAKEYSSIAYNPQTGQYYVNGTIPVTAEVKVGLGRALQQAREISNQTQQQAAQLQGQFTATAKQHEVYYGDQDKYFNQLPENLRPDEKIAAQLTAVLHPFDKDTPLGKMAAKMYSVLIRQGEVIKSLTTKQQNEIRIADDKRKAGPGINRGKNGRLQATRTKEEEADEVSPDDIIRELKGEL